jgi:hypothetical protein
MGKSRLQTLVTGEPEDKGNKKYGWLQVGSIIANDQAQTREEMNWLKVEDYAECVKAGDEFPAIVVYKDKEGNVHLSEGFHRLAAYKKAGEERIYAEVREGTLRDAIFNAVGANGTHGLPRTDADKRKAVRTILADKEWLARLKSDRAIAKHTRTSHTFVANERAAFNDPDMAGKLANSTKSARSMSPGKVENDGPPDETAMALLQETPIADDPEQQRQLAQEDPEIQFQAASLIAEGGAETVAEALAQVKPPEEKPAGKASEIKFGTRELFLKAARKALKKIGVVMFENREEFLQAARKALKQDAAA